MQHENPDTPVEYHAAMFRALGNQTRLSRTGSSVVFARDTVGRRDLSGDIGRAAAQLAAADIDVTSITADDVQVYQKWYDRMHNTRRIEQARVLITRPFGVQRGREAVSANRVALVDGWGVEVDREVVARDDYYDPDAINHVGGPGACRPIADYPRIEVAIARIRGRNPEFAAAPVVDNNMRGRRDA